MLDRCIAPLDRATFFARHWDREPLHVRRDEPERFLDLFSVAELDHRIACQELRWPFVRLFKEGDEIPPAAFTERRAPSGDRTETLMAVDACLAQVSAGATLSAIGLERASRAVAAFCGGLEQDLGRRIQGLHANCYLTPKASRGFSAHYDTHDVFVLQIEGTKRWRVHEGPLPLPLPAQACGVFSEEIRARAAGTTPVLEATLQPGDTLYLPRGFVHAAETDDGGASLHLTIGVQVRRRLDLLAAAVEAALARRAALEAYRAPAPVDAAADSDAAAFAELAADLTRGIRQELRRARQAVRPGAREGAGLLAARASTPRDRSASAAVPEVRS